MKKLFHFTAAVLCTTAAVHAGTTPSWSSVGSAYTSKVYIEWTTAGFDTIGASDSTTLKNSSGDSLIVPSSAGHGRFVLARQAFTGANGDAPKIGVRVDCYNSSGTIIYSTVVDSFLTQDGEAIDLGIGTKAHGAKFRVKLMSAAGSGAQVIINRWVIREQLPVQLNKQY